MPKPNVNITGAVFGCTNRVSTFIVNENPAMLYQYSIIGGIITLNVSGNVIVEWTSYGNNFLSVYVINDLTGCNAQNLINVVVDPIPKPVIDAANFAGCQLITRGSFQPVVINIAGYFTPS